MSSPDRTTFITNAWGSQGVGPKLQTKSLEYTVQYATDILTGKMHNLNEFTMWNEVEGSIVVNLTLQRPTSILYRYMGKTSQINILLSKLRNHVLFSREWDISPEKQIQF